ncbi:Copine-8 [Porphyridium purpureum]|uniref:Copine-8 n=1 Tax=Porphyridium purpureum TaxID=35688 RepID=A0A5J4Z263_PORPP|nr:Copine-8 [Porphyridium purpureum]|eukprot:POR6169..scf295_1
MWRYVEWHEGTKMSGYGAAAGAASAAQQAAARMRGTMPTRVALEIRAAGLKNRDVMNVSDPFVVAMMQDATTAARPDGQQVSRTLSGTPVENGFKELGRTETQSNTLSPTFATRIECDYFFEEQQVLVLAVWDRDSKSENLSRQQSLGYARATLGEIVSEGSQWSSPLLKQLPHSVPGDSSNVSTANAEAGKAAPLGNIFVTAHEVNAESFFKVSVESCGKGLDKKDLFGKSDPFFVVESVSTGGRAQKLYQSEVVKKTLDPVWKPMQLKVPSRQMNEPIRIIVWDHDEMSKPDLIGSFETTFKQLAAKAGTEFAIINTKLQSKRKYSDSGKFVVRSAMAFEMPTFMQYVLGGLRLNFSVGVDFTASNGAVDDPKSLHYTGDPTSPNQYIQVLTAVGQVLQDYDSDRMFPALGFGGRLLDGTISFNFCLNGTSDPHCYGVRGIIDAYLQALHAVRLAGPTNFAPLIQHTIDITRRAQAELAGGMFYNVLMILTDGVITDMQQTKDAIVEAAGLPMSIVIVGIGKSNFSAMQVLDGDTERITSSRGQLARRDIVQFVPFAEFESMPNERLAAHVLQEIPANVVEYFREIANLSPTYLLWQESKCNHAVILHDHRELMCHPTFEDAHTASYMKIRPKAMPVSRSPSMTLCGPRFTSPRLRNFTRSASLFRMDESHLLKTGIQVVNKNPGMVLAICKVPCGADPNRCEATLRSKERHGQPFLCGRNDCCADLEAPLSGPDPHDGEYWAGIFVCWS